MNVTPPPPYDLVVIGSGPAGEKGAAQAAYFGKRVALVECDPYLGGAGINTGTVPSKSLREAALYFSGLRQRGLYGIDYSLRENLTFADFTHREKVVVEREHAIIQHNLDRHQIQLFWGRGTLKDAHTVRVQHHDGSVTDLTTTYVLIATGSSPHHPPDIPFDGCLVLDSDSVLRMGYIPKSMIVVGGGVIGCEYASIFAALGIRVTLTDRHDRLLPFVDREIVSRLVTHLNDLGVNYRLNARLLNLERRESQVRINLDSGEELAADCVLFAAGRQSNTAGLGLEVLGIELGERGLIQVNDRYQTSVSNIYAAGDVIGFPALASTAMEQARVAMVHAFDLRYKEYVSPVLPFAVYTVPEISMVGLTEEDCQQQQISYLVGRAESQNNARGQIIGDKGMLKLIFATKDKKLLGVHHIGELASELVHIGAQVMSENGTINAFIHSVYNFPTLSDMYKYAAYDGLGNWERWWRDTRH